MLLIKPLKIPLTPWNWSSWLSTANHPREAETMVFSRWGTLFLRTAINNVPRLARQRAKWTRARCKLAQIILKNKVRIPAYPGILLVLLIRESKHLKWHSSAKSSPIYRLLCVKSTMYLFTVWCRHTIHHPHNRMMDNTIWERMIEI